AHHVKLFYEERIDPTESYRSGWKIEQRLRLTRVDVASKTFDQQVDQPRRQVRRYHLEYAPEWHQSFLESGQVEGRCAADEHQAPAENGAQELEASTACDRLPPMRFGYSHVAPHKVDGSTSVADLSGFEGFDERLIPLTSSPDHSVDDELADLFDV